MAEENLTKLVSYAIAMATSIAGIVIAFLGGELQTVAVLFGIGLFAMALSGLESLPESRRK